MNNEPVLMVHAIEMSAQGYVWKGDDPRMLVKAVRKVAAGDNFISPQLAEAVTFSSGSIKANPASQVTARELEILRLLGPRRQDRRSRQCARDFLQDGGQHHLIAQAEAWREEPFGPDPDRGGDGAGLRCRPPQGASTTQKCFVANCVKVGGPPRSGRSRT